MLVTGKDVKVFVFSPNKVELSKCIEIKLSKNTDQYNEDEWTKVIGDLAARRFLGRTISRNVFNHRYRTFSYELSSKKLIHKFSSDRFSTQFREELKEALQSCAETVISTSNELECEQPAASSNSTTITDNEEFIFSPSEKVLSECVENHLMNCNYFVNQTVLAKATSKLVARRFTGKTVTRKS